MKPAPWNPTRDYWKVLNSYSNSGIPPMYIWPIEVPLPTKACVLVLSKSIGQRAPKALIYMPIKEAGRMT